MCTFLSNNQLDYNYYTKKKMKDDDDDDDGVHFYTA